MKHLSSAVLFATCFALAACGSKAEVPEEPQGPLPPIADEPLEELPPAESVDTAPIHKPNEDEPA